MRFRLYTLLIFILFSSVVLAQRKRAFLVGISHYDTALTGYQWNNINGVEDVNLLTPVLKKQGFVITSLLNEQATFDNITHQLSLFVDKTKKGDIVYLHFSTHGQPIEDLNGDEDDDDQINQYVKKLREKIGNTGFLYVAIDACHAGTASRGNDDVVRGTNVGFTYNNKVFKPTSQKKSHYKIDASAKQANVLFLEACRPDQINSEIKIGGKRYGPLSYNIAQALSTYKLTTDADEFLKHIKASIMKDGHWPNNQNLVTETSY